MANIIEDNVVLNNTWEKLPYGGYLLTFARVNKSTGDCRLSFTYKESLSIIGAIHFKSYEEFLDHYEDIKSSPLDTPVPKGISID